jgi:hypothetical protein
VTGKPLIDLVHSSVEGQTELGDELDRVFGDLEHGLPLQVTRDVSTLGLASHDLTPEAAVSSVTERGWKARIVTKSSAPLIALGHQLRMALFKGLHRCPTVNLVLQGDHHGQVHRAAKAWAAKDGGISFPRELMVLSSDLTAASDLLPLDLIQALVEGLISPLES